ncbi:hypothetical protein EJ110_NYTH21295 [Nymphaea thermarum]|nr:hypothetical protein EJ110_NYTH21295 [Nymphaea thermarum]
MSRNFLILQVLLRLLAGAAALVAAITTAVNKTTFVYFGLSITAKFNYSGAYDVGRRRAGGCYSIVILMIFDVEGPIPFPNPNGKASQEKGCERTATGPRISAADLLYITSLSGSLMATQRGPCLPWMGAKDCYSAMVCLGSWRAPGPTGHSQAGTLGPFTTRGLVSHEAHGQAEPATGFSETDKQKWREEGQRHGACSRLARTFLTCIISPLLPFPLQ